MVHLTVCSYQVTYAFQSESKLYSCLNVKQLLARNKCNIWSLSDCNGVWTHNHLVCKRTLNYLGPNDWVVLWVLICTVHLTVCSHHVKYAFQSESTRYSYLNVKELLVQDRCNIRSLSDCDGSQTHNHLVHKRTLNDLAKLAKWLSCVVSTSLYGAFDCMFSSCHVRFSDWIHTL